MVKVIASSLRKGNVVEQDGKLHVILNAENIHPGKGNSVTYVDMRRKIASHRRLDPVARQQQRPPVGMHGRRPPRRNGWR